MFEGQEAAQEPQQHQSALSYEAEARKRSAGLRALLSYLVYEGQGIRIGLEISFCVILYSAVRVFIVWSSLPISERWSGLAAWFGSCVAVMLFDYFVLCRSACALRRSYLLGLCGAYDQALAILDRIGPASKSWVPLPGHLYHLHRCEALAQARSFEWAEHELNLAELSGGRSERSISMRSRLLALQGNYDAAEQELRAMEKRSAVPAVIRLEQGLLALEKNENPWEAKKIFKEVLGLPETVHFAGETTHQLAKAFFNACRLRTGEAEEGLEELGWSIERLRSASGYIDTLRPLLAVLLLERSMYYAGHKEPGGAVIDLKTALLYCAYPRLVEKAERIKEELTWRYSLPLVW